MDSKPSLTLSAEEKYLNVVLELAFIEAKSI